MSTTIYLLNIGEYAPEITALTYPLIHYYADKLGARIEMLTERRFPAWPITYEKMQIYERGQANGGDWHLYIDSDALIHPETPDFCLFLPRDTVAHHGADMAAVRWTYDRYFRRDGRNIGSCNWFTLASSWCLDLWHPLEDLTPAEAIANIRPTIAELNTVITREHLIDDYALSRNIARFGLKFTTLKKLLPEIGLPESNLFWHTYTDPTDEKVRRLRKVLDEWNLPKWIERYGQ